MPLVTIVFRFLNLTPKVTYEKEKTLSCFFSKSVHDVGPCSNKYIGRWCIV